MPAPPDEPVFLRQAPPVDQRPGAGKGRDIVLAPENGDDPRRRDHGVADRIEQRHETLDQVFGPAVRHRAFGDAPGPGQRSAHGGVLDPPGMGDQQHGVGLQPLRPVARLVGDDLGRHGAEAAAADRDRPGARSPAPVDQHGPFARGGSKEVERAARRGRDKHLAAVAAVRHPPSVPRRFRPDYANAHCDQRLDLVDEPAPVIELDADAVAEDQRRRVGNPFGLVDPDRDVILHAGRRGGEAQPEVLPAGSGGKAARFRDRRQRFG